MSILLGFYDSHNGELLQLCSFTEEHKLASTNKVNNAQLVRWFFLVFNFGVLCNALYHFPVSHLFIFFTNWGLLLTIASLFLSIYSSEDKKFTKKT